MAGSQHPTFLVTFLVEDLPKAIMLNTSALSTDLMNCTRFGAQAGSGQEDQITYCIILHPPAKSSENTQPRLAVTTA
jgi:hypothetical protein